MPDLSVPPEVVEAAKEAARNAVRNGELRPWQDAWAVAIEYVYKAGFEEGRTSCIRHPRSTG